jgi:hypothetical protein
MGPTGASPSRSHPSVCVNRHFLALHSWPLKTVPKAGCLSGTLEGVSAACVPLSAGAPFDLILLVGGPVSFLLLLSVGFYVHSNAALNSLVHTFLGGVSDFEGPHIRESFKTSLRVV